MNRDLRRRFKQRWPKVTDGDLDRADGHAVRLLGVLEGRYGYARQRAEHELLAFLDAVSRAERGAAAPPAIDHAATAAVAGEEPAPLSR